MMQYNRSFGRPRDEKIRKTILAKALELVGQEGYGALTIKRIADESKVGRPTLYRWWAAKGEILLEALVWQADAHASLEQAQESITQFFINTFRLAHGPAAAAVVGVMADAQCDRRLHKQLQELLISRRRQVLAQLLNARVKTTAGAFVVPIDTVVDMLFGAMWYRLLNGHGPLDDAFAKQLALSAEALMQPSGRNS